MTRLALFGLMAVLLVTSAPAEEETLETKAAPALADAERATLLYMREEEKLARDLYTTLADAHDLDVFRTIAAAEQRHMDAILGLLRRFEIEDVAGTNPVGTFSDEALAKLFAKLVEQGRKSPIEALAAGAHVEDRDIHDLNVGLAAAKNEDVRAVYANLVRASRNHLRAFTGRLAAEGVTYVPQHLEPSEYDAILASGHERGHGGGAGFRGGRGPGGGRGCEANAGRGPGRGNGRGGCDGDRASRGRGRGQGRGGCGGDRATRGRGRGGCGGDRGSVGRGRGRGQGQGRGRGATDRGDSRRGCDRDRECDRCDRRDEAPRGRRANRERDGTGAGRGEGRGRGRGRGCDDGCR